jgi:two-component system chemotaxis response regulator CheY
LQVKALVVDDSRAMRTIIRKALQALQFEVVEAEHGRAALERLKESGPLDLATVDWNMPEMNGLDFVHAVRRDAAHDAMRIVMVTTETEFSQMERALSSGANEYIMKPFDRDMLCAKLQLLGLTGA